MANKVALITGVTGQDGAYLAELLLNKGYIVHGIKRRSSTFNSGRVDHLYRDLHEPDVRFKLHYGDLTDGTNLIRIIQEVRPSEIYNLAAEPRSGELRGTRIHRQCRRPRHAAPARGDPYPRPGKERAILPSLDVGDVRQGPRGATVGDDTILPALALWRCPG